MRPGIRRNTKVLPPLVNATMILLIVLVDSAASMGGNASPELILSDATSEAIETAAGVGIDEAGYCGTDNHTGFTERLSQGCR
jgi:hypothetical protein